MQFIHSFTHSFLLPMSTNVSGSALSANLGGRGREGREGPYRDRGRGQTLGHRHSKPWLPGPEKYFSLTDENKDSHGCSGKFLVLAVKKPTLVGRCSPTSWPRVSGRPLAGLSISFVPQAGPQVLTSVRIFPKFSRSTKASFVPWNCVEGLVSCPWLVATHTHLLGWSKGKGLPTIPLPSSTPARKP